jgi:formylmethanofuran dehydrogenase subunit B
MEKNNNRMKEFHGNQRGFKQKLQKLYGYPGLIKYKLSFARSLS